MPTVKTAISIPEPLFRRVQAAARRLKISRSRLFSMVAEEFINRDRNRAMLEQINRVWKDGLDSDEDALLRAALSHHARTADRDDQW